ncbi:MAG: hypothetical protein ABIA59_04635 [Candidatus Latescibacterota bacterium]
MKKSTQPFFRNRDTYSERTNMVIKWLGKVVSGVSSEATQAATKAKSDEEIKKIRGKDIAHEAMKLRAKEQSEELSGLVRTGTPQRKREKFKSRVRQQVFSIVSKSFRIKPGDELEEITEEITDQIVTAADHDPVFMSMFDE